MHIFIIALCLLHLSYQCTGFPVKHNETLNFVPSALQHLANTCENAFLADTIKKNGENCKINETITSPFDLKCFMFYDINSQLCTVFHHSEFKLHEDYLAKINQSQNVASLCEHAKTWKFATIPKHPSYSILRKVFNDEVNCQKLCAVENILSDDANYYCAYFKWGADVIQSQGKTLLQNNNVVASAVDSPLNHAENSAEAPTSKNSNDSVVTNQLAVKPAATNLLLKPDELSKEVNQDKSGQKTQPTSTTLATNKTSEVIEKTSDINNGPKLTEQSVSSVGATSVKEEDKFSPVEEEPPRKDEVEKSGQLPEESKELVDSKDKLMESNPEGEENDDYDQVEDLQAEEGNKHNHGVVESDPDVGNKDHNNAKVGIESITDNNGNPPHRVADIFPNPIQESFTDDDDHFFPIFLTGIIIVVLLYILYHNKSKFTKVILGLIVEGRQSGKRRNSRGHAYRRLDTLEQAMSSNTAAPPSKIIY